MFEQSLIDDRSRRVSSSALAASVFVQFGFLAVGAVVPLLYTAELPIARRLAESWLLAPPLPPLPPPPAVAPPAEVQRFEAELQQPRTIPDRVAIIDDGAARPAPVLSRPVGVVGLGEAADGDARGVFGLGRLGLPNVPPPLRVRIGGRVQQALLIRRVPPVYPAEAIEQSIAGLVVLEAIIGVDGSIHELKVISGDPLRIIAASNRDLKEAVKGKNFRQDLYHRLSVLTIYVPPLRDRGEDSLLLLEHFQKMYSISSKLFAIRPDAVRRRRARQYPTSGNCLKGDFYL